MTDAAAMSDSPTAEAPHAKIPMRNEVWRKTLHVGSAAIPLAVLALGKWPMVALLALAALGMVTVEVVRSRWRFGGEHFNRLFGFMMRAREKAAVGGPIVLTGSSWMLLTYVPVLLFFPTHLAVASFFLLAFCDPAAALVGRSIGRTKIAEGKSLEGSLAFLITGLLVAGALNAVTGGQWQFVVVAAGALAATVAEATPGPWDDNFSVPVSAVLAMMLVEYAAGF